MKKWIAFFTVIVLIIGIGIWFIFFKSSSASSNSTGSNTATATVKKGQLDVNVSSSGTLAVINDQDIEATAQDTVASVAVSVNDTVTAGQTLATFDNGTAAISAPFDGVITAVEIAADDKVQDKQVLFHITDYTNLKTVVSVDELDIAKIAVNQPAEITVGAFEDVTYEGTVTDVAKSGTNNNGVASFDVEITLTSSDNLKPGMSAEASILTDSKSDTLYLPIEAVQTSGTKKYVIQTDSDGNTSQIEVEIGLSNTNYVEITSGLKEGDIVQVPQTQSSSSSTQSFREGGMMMDMGGGGGQQPPTGGGGPGGN